METIKLVLNLLPFLLILVAGPIWILSKQPKKALLCEWIVTLTIVALTILKLIECGIKAFEILKS